jgi:hypothetical protein
MGIGGEGKSETIKVKRQKHFEEKPPVEGQALQTIAFLDYRNAVEVLAKVWGC